MELEKEIAFTMTATIRPAIIDHTICSFSENFSDFDFQKATLFVNIDPLPEMFIHRLPKVIDVVRKHFGEVHINSPKQANFATAVKWLWSQPATPYIFHMEDDWELVRKIKMQSVLDIMTKTPSLYQVRLCKFLKKSARELYGLSPCLIRREFYSTVAQHIVEDCNPERQLRGVKNWGLDAARKQGVKRVCAFPHNKIIIKDIGREWRVKHGMSKQAEEIDFVKWEWRKNIIK